MGSGTTLRVASNQRPSSGRGQRLLQTRGDSLLLVKPIRLGGALNRSSYDKCIGSPISVNTWIGPSVDIER